MTRTRKPNQPDPDASNSTTPPDVLAQRRAAADAAYADAHRPTPPTPRDR